MDGFLDVAAVFLFNYSCEHCFGRDFRRQRRSQPPSLPNHHRRPYPTTPPTYDHLQLPHFPAFMVFMPAPFADVSKRGGVSPPDAVKALSPDLLIGRGCFRWMVCGRGKQIASLVIRESSFVSLPHGQRDRESCNNEEPESSVTLCRQTRTRLGTVANDAVRPFPDNVGR